MRLSLNTKVFSSLLLLLLASNMTAVGQCTCSAYGGSLITNGNFEDPATVATPPNYIGFETDYSGTAPLGNFGIFRWTNDASSLFLTWCNTAGGNNYLVFDGATGADAANPPFDVLRYQNLPVTLGSTYHFYYDAMNLTNSGPYANLTVSINGVPLGTASVTNTCLPFVRTEYCWVADAPLATIVVNAGTGSVLGREFGIDNVYFGKCDPGVGVYNADSSVLDTTHCYGNYNHGIIGLPLGGTFTGCGIVNVGGNWYFNPALATATATSLPYTCAITYTVAGFPPFTYNMTVNDTLHVDAGPDQIVCTDTITLSSTTNYQGTFSFNWTPSANLSTPDLASTIGVTPIGTTTYMILAIDKITGCLDSDKVNILNDRVSSSFTTVDSICQREQIFLTSVISGTDSTFIWDFGDGTPVDTVNPNTVHTFDTSGVMTIKLIVNNKNCTDTFFKPVYVFPGPYGFAEIQVTDTLLCVGERTGFIPVFPPGYAQLLLDFGSGYQSVTNALSFDAPGNYTVKMKAIYAGPGGTTCGELEVTDIVSVFPIPRVNLGPDTFMCLNGKAIDISNSYPNPGAITHLWSTGDNVPAIQARHYGTYWLTISNENGCNATDSILITKSCYIDVPNAFSPNGDGSNDYFLPRQLLSKEVAKFHMTIYDRWGQMIFETNKIDGRGWDGKFNEKDQPVGVYVYVVEVVFANKATERYQGNVTLLR
jgi:gliding motility-associated-like protein